MANETITTVVGNLTDDPDLRFTPSGAAVANFTVASTPRNYDRNAGEWKDGETLFLPCSVWRQAAENVAESLTKGMAVVAKGRLKQRNFEDRNGNKRSVIEMDVDTVGPDLSRASAKITKNPSRNGGSTSGGGFTDQSQPAASQGQDADPWGTPSPQSAGADDPWA